MLDGREGEAHRIVVRNILCRVIAIGIVQPVGDAPHGDALLHRKRAHIIAAEHRHAARHNLPQELGEGVLDFMNVLIEIQMILVDVEHQRQRWVQR